MRAFRQPESTEKEQQEQDREDCAIALDQPLQPCWNPDHGLEFVAEEEQHAEADEHDAIRDQQ